MSQLSQDTKVDPKNVQGDVILCFPKRKEEFVFFVIDNPKLFKAQVSSLKITTTEDVQCARKNIKESKLRQDNCLLPVQLLNIAFTQKGLHALGIKDDLGDVAFSNGQLLDAKDLGDDGIPTEEGGFIPNWERAFTERIDGVLLAAGETPKSVKESVQTALKTLGPSVRVVYKLKGSVRPGDQKGHEHFGWLDGISNPAIKGFDGEPLPGQLVVPPGILLVGKAGDPVTIEARPEWAVEGSFLVFRQLSQLVPEFHDFLASNPLVEAGPDRKLGSELLGARLFGRWKSGDPLMLHPHEDHPDVGKNKKENNDFVYPEDNGLEGQTNCPFAAHIRKMNPRTDLKPESRHKFGINRSGIAYGPEVSQDESDNKCTEYERGLAFVCYQSSLQVGPVSNADHDRGFRFIQRFWANNINFPKNKAFTPGWDPIVGQANGAPRGTLVEAKKPELVLPQDFVVSRGGEYFFSPSIQALKTVFSGKPVIGIPSTEA